MSIESYCLNVRLKWAPNSLLWKLAARDIQPNMGEHEAHSQFMEIYDVDFMVQVMCAHTIYTQTFARTDPCPIKHFANRKYENVRPFHVVPRSHALCHQWHKRLERDKPFTVINRTFCARVSLRSGSNAAAVLDR